VVQHCSVAEDRSPKAGASYFSSGGMDIHEVLHVEMFVEQSSAMPSSGVRRKLLWGGSFSGIWWSFVFGVRFL